MRARGLALAATFATAAVVLPPRVAAAVDREACFSAAESAQQLRKEGKLRSASDKLATCAQDGCPNGVRKDCVKWMAEVKDAVPSIVVTAHDAHGNDVSNVSVSVDGEKVASALDGRPIEVDAGTHQIHFERDGSKPVDKSVVVASGQKLRDVDVQFEDSEPAPQPAPALAPAVEPAPASRPVPLATILLGAVGVAALASTTYFWVSGRSDFSGLQSSCSPGCDPSRADPVRTKLLVGDVSLGVAVVSIGLATWLFVARGPSQSTTAAQVGVEPRPGGGVASVSGAF